MENSKTLMKFRLDEGSTVELTTFKDGVYRGEVLANSQKTAFKNAVTLVNPRKLDSDRKTYGNHTFFHDEISDVKKVQETEKTLKGRPQKPIPTFMIEDWQTLNDLYRYIGSTNLREIGCHLESVVKGRYTDRTPQLLVLNLNHDTIVIVKLSKLIGGQHSEEELWESLSKNIFSNAQITKVLFDSTLLYDYLFHRHSITLVNVFDLQRADQYLLESGGFQPLISSDGPNRPRRVGLKTDISDFWEAYLPKPFSMKDYAITNGTESCFNPQSKELNITGTSEFLERALLLRVKYLLTFKAEIEKAMMRPLNMLHDYTNRDLLDLQSEQEQVSTLTTYNKWDE